jgi:misacylated tRNA(Ala) deacylase
VTEQLYLHDSYLKEFDARVTIAGSDYVVLDRTAFYPGGGGQPCDTGFLRSGSEKFVVTETRKSENGDIHHIIPFGNTPKVGENVCGVIDWDLRYAYMRHHTALHIVSGVAYLHFGAKITGSQIYSGRARIDFNIEAFDSEKLSILEAESNKVVVDARKVNVRFVSRKELLSNPGLLRVNPTLYPEGDKLRVIEIEGFDAQFDGGTHVANTSEVGKIVFSKFENKGKFNKRIQIMLRDGLKTE